MNAGNRAKNYKKYILSLPIAETKKSSWGYTYELRFDRTLNNDFWVYIEYDENGNFTDSTSTNIFSKEDLMKRWNFIN